MEPKKTPKLAVEETFSPAPAVPPEGIAVPDWAVIAPVTPSVEPKLTAPLTPTPPVTTRVPVVLDDEAVPLG